MPSADPASPRQASTAAGVRRLEIHEIESPAFGGREFGAVGGYERISGRVFCDLDPAHPLNATIVGLDHAPCNAAGRVAYEADICIVKPVRPACGNGWLLYEVLNRGNKLAISRINNVAASNRLDRAEDAGDGLLMRHGFTLVWSGWQGDVPPGADRMLAKIPIATGADGPITGTSREEFIAEASGLASDEFVKETSASTFIGTLTYPTADLDVTKARLTVRNREREPRVTPADLTWHYLDARRIEIKRPAGFDRGSIYEFVYTARDPIVMGIGLASIRDVVSYLRDQPCDDAGNPNPLDRSHIRYALGFGASQSGRVIRDFVYEGLNQDLAGARVFDAIFPVSTGSRRSFVNALFAQPGRFSRQHEDHSFGGDQFPFTYRTLTDAISGRADGILVRAREAGVCPKVMHLDADTELWAGRGSLLVTDCTGADVAMPEDARVYLASSTPHAVTPPARKDVARHRHNPLPYSMPLRALLVALIAWVEQRVAPPSSRFPSRAAGTLVPLADARAQFPAIPGVRFPEVLNELRLTDHSVQPPIEGPAYPVFVGAVDADGNTLDGVRHPLIAAPVATFTGWNPRAAGYGEGDLFSILGSLIPFAASEAERRAAGDPRPSLEARYGSRAGWAKKLAAAAEQLVAERLLLREDADRLVKAAEKSWDVSDLV